MHLLEDEGIDQRKRNGMTWITCGALLLGIDLVIVLIIGTTGLLAGSTLWTWWTSIEAIVGCVAIGLGMHLRGSLYR